MTILGHQRNVSDGVDDTSRTPEHTFTPPAPGLPGRWQTRCIDFKTRHNADCDGATQAQTPHPPASLPGGYSVGVPPDPIPNSAVKPDCANGTIAQAMEE